MYTSLKKIIDSSESMKNIYQPVFFRLSVQIEKQNFFDLVKEKPFIKIFDQIKSQVEELLKLVSPKTSFSKEKLSDAAKEYIGSLVPEEFGVWVYYPWSNTIVHLLDEKEFIIVRTNRNKNKITSEEQDILGTKKVGVIGLSVGQSVSLALALERSFGELRIADFDVLDMSNLNRIRTGVHNLQLKKSVACAREISEIDPYLKVTCFHDGINDENIDSFFSEGGNLDALIEECDNLNIKITSRLKARKLGIPVIMDTSDRGMLDIERYDLERERPIFHGLLEHYNLNESFIDPEKRMEIIYSILDKNKITPRFKESINEIGKTLTTWPQLASSVISGGANAAEIYRKIMLKCPIQSGRYYVDLDELVG